MPEADLLFFREAFHLAEVRIEPELPPTPAEASLIIGFPSF